MSAKLTLKIGTKVYDEILFPGIEGEVVDIEKYLLVIKFGEKEYFFPYKDDGEGKEHLGGEHLNHFPPTLSTTPYQIIGLTPICKEPNND